MKLWWGFLIIYNGEQNHKVVPKSTLLPAVRSLINQEVFIVVQVSQGYIIKCL